MFPYQFGYHFCKAGETDDTPPDAEYKACFDYVRLQIDKTGDLPGYDDLKVSSSHKANMKNAFGILESQLIQEGQKSGMPEKLRIKLFFEGIWGEDWEKFTPPTFPESKEQSEARRKNGGNPVKPFVLGYCTRIHVMTEKGGTKWYFLGKSDGSWMKIEDIGKLK